MRGESEEMGNDGEKSKKNWAIIYIFHCDIFSIFFSAFFDLAISSYLLISRIY